MKPAHFQYCAPGELDEALEVLESSGPDAKVLAGGQSLIPLLNMRLATPQYLIDINRIAALDYIDARQSHLALGAIARQGSVEWSTVARQRHPLLVEVLQHIGHMQIRNRGTLAGSIAHADPAAELPALLRCLDGEVVARGRSCERIIKAEHFFTDHLTTSLRADEIITELRLPWLPAQAGWSCVEFARRAGDYALAGAIAVVVPDAQGKCQAARLSYFGIAPTPVRGHEIERMLIGIKLDEEALQAAAQQAQRLVDDGFSDIHATSAYRRALTAEATRRALSIAWRRCQSKNCGMGQSIDTNQEGNNRGGKVNAREQAAARQAGASPAPTGMTVNGRRYERRVPTRLLLSDFLRHELHLTGTHVGCEHGVCGCCTILLNGEPVRSCLMLAVQADGMELTTIEGFAGSQEQESLHPIQQAFRERHALQCGFCTPGIIVSVQALLREHPMPTDEEIRHGLAGNLCRCTGYQNIVAAVRLAATYLADRETKHSVNANNNEHAL